MKKIIAMLLLVVAIAGIYWLLQPKAVSEPVAAVQATEHSVTNVEAHGGASTSASPSEVVDEIPASDEVSAIDGPSSADIEDYSQRSLSSFLSEDDEYVFVQAAEIYGVTLDDLRTMTLNLGADGHQDQQSYVAVYELEQEIGNSSGVILDTVQCSNEMCGVIFSSYDAEQRDRILQNTFRNDSLKAFSRGGVLRPITEDGIFYGIAIVVLDNGKPLKLQ
ncbi:MAG: hypothetical protein LAT53_02730 [Idiomarina sp.]|nr:hypothetical protein [Idiomarina sp.]